MLVGTATTAICLLRLDGYAPKIGALISIQPWLTKAEQKLCYRRQGPRYRCGLSVNCPQGHIPRRPISVLRDLPRLGS